MWPVAPPILHDGVIALRLPCSSDAEAVVAACQDPDIAHFTRVPVPYRQVDAEGFISDSLDSWREKRAAIFVAVDPSGLLGACSLHAVDLDARQAELGYWVAPWARGRGIARAAAGLVTAWGHEELGLVTIDAVIEVMNAASIRAVTAAGYRLLAGEDRTELKGTVRLVRRYRHRRETGE